MEDCKGTRFISILALSKNAIPKLRSEGEALLAPVPDRMLLEDSHDANQSWSQSELTRHASL